MGEPNDPDDERWYGVDDERLQYEPWFVAYRPEPEPDQTARNEALGERPGYRIHPRAFVAPDAHVTAERCHVGAFTTIAAGCVVRGDVEIGEHCSLNAGVVTMGEVRIGSFVRIASYAVLVGENHVFDDLDRPIAAQGLTTEGLVVEDDVWIGANVTVLDGVRVGTGSVIAAGAVVTRDVPPRSVVAGVPARVIAERTADGVRRRPPADRVAAFDRRVADQWPDVLGRCEADHDGVRTYVDRPGVGWGPRPLNDAVEIAGAFGAVPPIAPPDQLIARIQAQQDPVTGLFVDPNEGPAPLPLAFSDREWELYGILSCGYALEVLGSGPAHPVHVVEDCSGDRLEELLDGLDWEWLAWPSGSWIDAFGTAIHLNRRHHGSTNDHPVLWGWLATHVHRHSGMWGRRLDPAGDLDFGWLMAVNGYYRMTRGTYAQFGVDLPHPEAAIDTVLAHAREHDWFTSQERNACNVLDVIHPLWLLGRQVDHRRGEIRNGAARILDDLIGHWVDGAGLAWAVPEDEPGLQGTEMWLSIAHLALDVLGESAGLAWQPQGVHRLEPAGLLGRP